MPSQLDDIRIIWRCLDLKHRRGFWWLLLLSLAASVSEVLSIGSLLPFLAVLVNPELLMNQPIIQSILQSTSPILDGVSRGFLGGNSNGSVLSGALDQMQPLIQSQSLIRFFGILFGVLVLLASLIRWGLSAACARYAHRLGAAVGQAIFQRALLQPYAFHLSRNSSEVIDVVTTRVQMVVSSVFMTSLHLLTNLLMIGFITITLVWFNPLIVGPAVVGFASLYVLIYWLTRRRLTINSERMSLAGAKRYQILQEGMGGLRDIHIDSTAPYFMDAFQRADDIFRHTQSQNAMISASPRYIAEGLGTFLIAIFAVMLATQGTDAQNQAGPAAWQQLIPMLGVLVMAAQRMLPMLQQVYSGWTSIRGITHSLTKVRDWIELPLPPMEEEPHHLQTAALSPSKWAAIAVESQHVCNLLADRNSTTQQGSTGIELRNAAFRYQPQMPEVLTGVDLVIPRGCCVGLKGITGSGKSTLLDILMGLLEPTTGQLLVDGQPITAQNAANWRRQIAHVPQHIFLADTTIAENIAFGQPVQSIDMERVQQAAQRAQIADFIEALPGGYQTMVGERGIRLSGGQRQRLGIARALYKKALVLVLDEATSALDPATEEAITASLASMATLKVKSASGNKAESLENAAVERTANDRVDEIAAGRSTGPGQTVAGWLAHWSNTAKSEEPPLTMIIVSHRPSALKFCPVVYRLEQGGLVLDDPTI